MKIAAIVALLIIAVSGSSQQSPIQQQAITLKRVIERNHTQPRAVDDRFSENLFNDLVKQADPDKLFFTRDDINQLAVFKSQLDDELRGNGWLFLPKITGILAQKSAFVKTMVKDILERELEFSSNQEFIPHNEKSDFEANNEALKKYWQLYLKSEVLTGLASFATADSTKKLSRKELPAKEKAIRAELLEEIKQQYRDAFNEKEIAAFLEETYLKCLAACFDPHTNYLPPKEYESFTADLSGGQIIYGFQLKENERNEVIIARLAPGSPAWKCGELHREDVVTAIQYGTGPEVIINKESVAEVNELIARANGEKIVLTVRKKDGAIKTVPLKPEKVNTDEGLVKSFILERGKKAGYIALPDFYEANGETTRGCAADVASEIIRLKKENIDGLILDLRYNGGGSMQEAIEMAGIFIDDGPLFQLKTGNEKTKTVKDINRGTIYDGPMVVLVNGASASASEILAATLQDYRRAIIAGGKTFGKSTGQVIFPVDTTGKFDHPGSREVPPFGYVKVTLSKIYRLPGTTAQHSGVTPDVILPDPTEVYGMHESKLPYSIIPDAVNANTYYKPLNMPNTAGAKSSSEQRQAGSDGFKKLKSNIAQQLAERNTQKKIPLKWELFEQYYRGELKKARAENEEPKEPANAVKADVTSFEKERLKINPDHAEANNEWKKRIQNSLFINEAFQVLIDILNK